MHPLMHLIPGSFRHSQGSYHIPLTHRHLSHSVNQKLANLSLCSVKYTLPQPLLHAWANSAAKTCLGCREGCFWSWKCNGLMLRSNLIYTHNFPLLCLVRYLNNIGFLKWLPIICELCDNQSVKRSLSQVFAPAERWEWVSLLVTD